MAKRKGAGVGFLQSAINRVTAKKKKISSAISVIKKKQTLEKRLKQKIAALKKAEASLAGIKQRSKKRK